MVEKRNGTIKYISLAITIGILIVSIAVYAAKIDAKSSNNREDIVELKTEFKKQTDIVNEIKVTQHEQKKDIEKIADGVERIEKKL